MAIRREFGEEALNTLGLADSERRRVEKNLEKLFAAGETLYTGYVDDDRNTDNAWIETTAVLFHDEEGAALNEFRLSAGDDATAVQWTMVRLHREAWPGARHKPKGQARLPRRRRTRRALFSLLSLRLSRSARSRRCTRATPTGCR